jgi:FkbM family methyltransferase
MPKIYEYLPTLQLSTDQVIFEIGCHWGEDTEKILNVYKNANYYAFEPDPRNKKFITERNIDRLVNMNYVALSDTDGEMDFYLSSGYPSGHYDELDAKFNNTEWTRSSSLSKPKAHLNHHTWCKFDEIAKVQTIKLDTFCTNNNINYIDFLWMDVQGHELQVFNGGSNILKNTKYIYTEFSAHELYEGQKSFNDITTLLSDFEVVFVDGDINYGGDILLKNKLID